MSTTVPLDKKRFIPLENNPEVMSHLAHRLGLSPKLSFHDVYSIDDPDLLAFENAKMPTYDGAGVDEPVIWFKQTIGNACGLIGLLHGVCNGEAAAYIQPGSDFEHLMKEAIPLKPEERAELLYQSATLEAAHQSAAQEGDTVAPPAEETNYLHFICFVKTGNGHLWELDGGRPGPADRGMLDPEEDVLSEKALQLGVRAFMAKQAERGGGDLRFSLVALGPALD
ncbi:hypothetical protein PLICRDRAFT_702111 [Plicaturopsis crispa FD-325 SS-3]|uniref:Ubiquitin carboxyl-terminal hydrolase n=1 Tax=Plicaturopsis crispa FD-325 SS-3 TaxID=944288 RepID=A0A0C9SKR0_PLICR|nr:hypothetical protein PLICRDRAFT_702111 [Plicaturopsis crispa FD-325 SS-3]